MPRPTRLRVLVMAIVATLAGLASPALATAATHAQRPRFSRRHLRSGHAGRNAYLRLAAAVEPAHSAVAGGNRQRMQ
jgi:hypothetical protein